MFWLFITNSKVDFVQISSWHFQRFGLDTKRRGSAGNLFSLLCNDEYSYLAIYLFLWEYFHEKCSFQTSWSSWRSFLRDSGGFWIYWRQPRRHNWVWRILACKSFFLILSWYLTYCPGTWPSNDKLKQGGDQRVNGRNSWVNKHFLIPPINKFFLHNNL